MKGRAALRMAAAALIATGLTMATAAAQSSSSSDAERSVVLAFDASGSMAGDRIEQARASAADFVEALPPDVAVGVIAFADDARTLVTPSTDRPAVQAAIAGIRADGDTALIDAVIDAMALTPDRIVVLSDGEDTASTASLPALLSLAGSAGIPADVVALAPSKEHEAVLRDIAEISGGSYASAADAASLAAAFGQVAERVAQSGGIATGGIATGGIESGIASAPPATAQSSTTTTPVERSLFVPIVLSIAVMAAVALLTLAVAALLAGARHRRAVRSALTAYAAPPGASLRHSAAASLPQLLHERFRDASWYERISRRLDLAGIRMRPTLWIAITIGSSVAASIAIGALSGALVLGLLAGLAVLGAFLLVVSSRVAKAIRDFDTELPDFLLLVASGMRSGLSFAQSVDAAAAEGVGQVARQMTRVVAESRLGAPIEEALLHAADRMQSEDLRWTVTALAMQRQIGGNLSTILETAALAVRGRAELRREVRTLSAEGRLSAYVLIALPLAVFAFMALSRPEYIDFFWTETLGAVTLAALGLLVAVGALWIRSIVRIEV